MKNVLIIIACSIIMLTSVLLPPQSKAATSVEVQKPSKKIAMLISGHGHSDPALSYDLEELVQSYLIFHRNNVEIDIVSPKGGAVLVKNNKDKLTHVSEFKTKTSGLDKLANTLSAERASDNDYDALFIVGGDGAVFDLPFDVNTQRLITKFAKTNTPIAAVCHGPAALVNIQLDDGRYFVADKYVNSFTYLEDHAFKKENIDKYPMIVQTELEARGAHFIANSPMLPFVSRDGNLITAQNPTSVAKAAEALLITIGITPVAREAFKDEATMELIAMARSMGGSQLDIAMSKKPDSYDTMYLALYGLYGYKLAQTAQDKALELQLMEKIAEYFKHPQYATHMISTYLEIGNKQQAKRHFNIAKQQFTDFELPVSLADKLD
ncbi:type 1 glutamine amidotransferase domain-containing protein [Pseudoalteromonas sp. PAR1]|uniref:type 1 glutamine amidotransferase domain-containing protein n=1 Tax=Pseudoalteromonas sp. PAR1 TaxID=2853443 RepID=UPI00248B45FC|nr:type 1 glutamine amidotransferase domain-containing protein [Pseudoalteromonas sp. PAR1]